MIRNSINKEGIVVRLSKIKEADAMVDCLGPDGFFSFFARGISKLTGKNSAAVQPLTQARFTLSVSPSGSSTLSESQIVASFLRDDDFGALASQQLIMEVASKLVQPDEAPLDYPWLLEALSAIKEGFDPYSSALFFFARALVNGGMGLDEDECVSCQKKGDIVAISFSNGGFVCRNCFPKLEGSVPKSVMELKEIRYAFRFPLEKFRAYAYPKGDALHLIEDLAQYLNDLTGISLKSIPILLRA